MVAYALATPEARETSAMILTLLNRINSVQAQGLIGVME